MYTINIIGCGKVGSTLGYLLAKNGYKIQGIVNRSLKSSRQASDFIPGSTAVISLDDLKQSDILLIATNDDQLTPVIQKLTSIPLFKNNPVVFHCSGASTSSILKPLERLGARVASIHPAMSFHHPKKNVSDFAGTVCTLEGMPEACELLKEVFLSIGAITIPIETGNKGLYHVAMVLSCNYFLTLMDTSLQLLRESGIDSCHALKILQPLMLGTWENMLESSAPEALTGPISRGDSQLVNSQLALLKAYDVDIARAYQALGKLTLRLAQEKKELSDQCFKQLEKVLNQVIC